jgi:hypothetical protein
MERPADHSLTRYAGRGILASLHSFSPTSN